MVELDRVLLARRVDQLLAPWRDRPVPGMTVGVFQGGETLLHASAGLASLELGVPIGPETVFRIASVSKQFTCAAILMLAAEGRLDIEAPVGTYLPEFPDMGATVTVAHLMHNSSGVRDMLELMRMGGADLSMQLCPSDLMAAIFRQQTLNFAPGSRFMYSNSNFLLLGRIVEAVAGEQLGAFLHGRIFAPLGMNRTRLTESTSTVVPGLATGYMPDGDTYIRASHGFPLHGEGGLVSCVTDLALWERNFATGRVGGTALGEALVRQQDFASGVANFYARGLVVRDYRGVSTVTHGGLWPGFKTEFLRVPDRDLLVVAISNNGGADPNLLAHRVLDVLVEGVPGVRALPPPMLTEALLPMTGRFLEPETGATLEVEAAPDGTPVFRSNGIPSAPALLPDGRLGTSRGIASMAVRAAGPDALEVELDAGHRSLWRRTPAQPALPPDLPGRYCSTELAATWEIAELDGSLHVRVAGPVVQGQLWEIVPVQDDHIRIIVPWSLIQRAWLDVRLTRDAQGNVTGLLASGGRVKSVQFEKV